MTDFDADEPVLPLPVHKKRFWTTDRIIGWSGASLALMAAFFPWYVFVNEDKFGLEALRRLVSGEAAPPSRSTALDSDANRIAERERLVALPRLADDIVTGTVPTIELPEATTDQPLPAQPFPAAPRNFRLLKVIKGQAMIEDATGIFVVRKGDVLPDRTKVAELEQRDGKWVLKTDGGVTYTTNEN